MPNEFQTSMHSGDAPRDLRVGDPRPRTNDSTGDHYRRLLEARGDYDIAAMLFAPTRPEVKKSHKSKAERRLARAHALAMQLTHEALGGAA